MGVSLEKNILGFVGWHFSDSSRGIHRQDYSFVVLAYMGSCGGGGVPKSAVYVAWLAQEYPNYPRE